MAAWRPQELTMVAPARKGSQGCVTCRMTHIPSVGKQHRLEVYGFPKLRYSAAATSETQVAASCKLALSRNKVRLMLRTLSSVSEVTPCSCHLYRLQECYSESHRKLFHNMCGTALRHLFAPVTVDASAAQDLETVFKPLRVVATRTCEADSCCRESFHGACITSINTRWFRHGRKNDSGSAAITCATCEQVQTLQPTQSYCFPRSSKIEAAPCNAGLLQHNMVHSLSGRVDINPGTVQLR